VSKTKVTGESFLKNMSLAEDDVPLKAQTIGEPPRTKAGSGRAGLKHIGGYFDREIVEMIAVLRARLDLDNSQLIKRAIEELHSREIAARKFGDR
jgi:hypothetical protein